MAIHYRGSGEVVAIHYRGSGEVVPIHYPLGYPPHMPPHHATEPRILSCARPLARPPAEHAAALYILYAMPLAVKYAIQFGSMDLNATCQSVRLHGPICQSVRLQGRYTIQFGSMGLYAMCYMPGWTPSSCPHDTPLRVWASVFPWKSTPAGALPRVHRGRNEVEVVAGDIVPAHYPI